MSELNNVDKLLLTRLKSEIARISGLQATAGLAQKDYDFLIYYIEEKTGNRLSLTTIKRIWRDEYQRLPHLSTLDMLTRIAFDTNWMTLKKNYLQDTEASERQPNPDVVAVPQEVHSSRRTGWVLFSVVMLVPVFIGGWYFIRPGPGGDAAVSFSAKATADGKIPNTVIFTYDVTALDAEKFFIQQSWDQSKKIEVARNGREQTDIYYEPGYHYAKLFANTRIVREIPVHVRYPDWFVRLRYPNGDVIHVDEPGLEKNGTLGVKRSFFERPDIAGRGKNYPGFMLSKDFEIDADHAHLSAKVKMDSLQAPDCPTVSLLIKGQNDYALVSFGKKGCESNINLRCSDVYESGKHTDHSAFGTDIFTWQTVAVVMQHKRMSVLLNGKIIKQLSYTKELGELKELDFLFDGNGYVDDVRLDEKGRRSYSFEFP